MKLCFRLDAMRKGMLLKNYFFARSMKQFGFRKNMLLTIFSASILTHFIKAKKLRLILLKALILLLRSVV